MSEVENKVVPVEGEEKDYVEDGKNKLIVKCKFCGSKILDKKSAKYMTLEFLLILTSAGSGICTVLLGAQLQFHWAPAWFTVLLIYGFSFIFTLGCAVIPFVLTAEVFLPEVRSFCNSVVMAFTWVFNFLTLVIFHPLVEAIGLGPVFYFFSVVCFTGTIYSQFCIPETKGLSADAIQLLFLKGRRQSIKSIKK